jgi:7-cyano-7-deazaguanine synthase
MEREVMKGLILYSGGLDSTMLLYDLIRAGNDITAVWFDYGQKSAVRELAAARYFTELYGCRLIEINIKGAFAYSDCSLLKGNGCITKIIKCGNDITYQHNHTELAFRNGVLLSIGISIACDIYPNEQVKLYYGAIKTPFNDCSIDFMSNMDALAKQYTNGKISVNAPYIDRGKDWVMLQAKKYGIETDKTWSCYEDGEVPCGVCPACLDRKIVESIKCL